MTTIEKYFDKIFVINLARRRDRWKDFLLEMERNGIAESSVQQFIGYDHPSSGHAGCSRSHRLLLRLIADGPWPRVMIFEDDANVITKQRLKEAGFGESHPVWKTHCSVMDGNGTLNERFRFLSDFIPPIWDVIYPGCSYGEPPISRYNIHMIRCGFMQTTSSYGITREFAKTWTEKVDARMGSSDLNLHPGPIDNVFGSMSHDHLYYVFQPRLMYQRKSMSDIEGIETHHLFSMSDFNPLHEGSV